MPLAQKTLDIDEDTYAFIAARDYSDRRVGLRHSARGLLAGGAPPAGPPSPVPPTPTPTTVVFRIPSGTGRGPWNDGSCRVIAKVGDTLRIINGDSVAHRLHTAGRPFPRPETDIFPADLVLERPFDPSADGPLSDHDQGPQAIFFSWKRRVTDRLAADRSAGFRTGFGDGTRACRCPVAPAGVLSPGAFYGRLRSQAPRPCVAANSLRSPGTIVSPATSTFGIPGAATTQALAPDSRRNTPKSDEACRSPSHRRGRRR